MLIFATRPSALARWQTEHVIELLQTAFPGLACRTEIITTQGDRILERALPEIGGKGLFTHELEDALRARRVDAAVHSLKDLPTADAPGLTLGAIPPRADAHDAWICPAGYTLATLPTGSVVGTSSVRRAAQLLARRPDLDVRPLRGNVDTRLRKVQEGPYDAIILAAAGVTRLGLHEHITESLPFEVMLPAPGQGALAVQCRADDEPTLARLRALDHLPTRRAVTAERAFLAALGGGCSLPVGAHARADGDCIALRAVILTSGGAARIELASQGTDPVRVGVELAQQALAQGAAELLERVA